MAEFNEIDEQQEQNPSKDDVSNKDIKGVEGNGEPKTEDSHKKDVSPSPENTKNESETLSPSPAVEKNSSFGEEINFLSHLKVPEKKAWTKLKSKIEEAIRGKMATLEIQNPKNADEAENRDGSPPPPTIVKNSSLREQSISLSDLKEFEKKALAELRSNVEEAIHGNNTLSLWGVPLLPSKGDNATDEILLKFLRAREFNPNEALEMLKNALQWRKENDIDSILNDNFDANLDSIGYMNGVDRQGHPVCYNNFGLFGDDELYNDILGTEEKRERFLRWRVQLMEKGIEKLDFKHGGVSSFLQINNLKDAPSPLKKELRLATNNVVAILQDNYPEFVAKNIFINVPFWFYAFTVLLSPFLTQRTKSKFVFARPARVAETLLKYISAAEIPVHYGGLKRENDSEFSTVDAVMEVIAKAGSTESIEIPVLELDGALQVDPDPLLFRRSREEPVLLKTGTCLIWEVTVLGWEVSYKEEFVPSHEGSYSIIVQRERKMGGQEGPVRNSFKNNEPGKVVLTIENVSFKKKRVLYRYKINNSSSS